MGDHFETLALQRHAPLSGSRTNIRRRGAGRLAPAYLGRQRHHIKDIYINEHPGERQQGRFRWLISTCLAGAVGVLAIAVVISGSMERDKRKGGLLDPLTQSLQKSAMEPFKFPTQKVDGLNWAVPKTQRLAVDSGVLSTKYIIRETMRQRVGGREMVLMKPYALLTSRLANVEAQEAEKIPDFDPLALYSASPNRSGKNGNGPAQSQSITTDVVELLDGVLPAEDGQQLDTAEVTRLVLKFGREEDDTGISAGANSNTAAAAPSDRASILQASIDRNWKPFTSGTGDGFATLSNTVLTKNDFETETDEPAEQSATEIKAVAVQQGDSLVRLIREAGAAGWQAAQMAEAATTLFPAKALSPGQTVYFTLVPSLNHAEKLEVTKLSIFAPGGIHKVTVTRNAAGDFAATRTPMTSAALRHAISGNGGSRQTSLYESFFQAARQQGLTDTEIMRILRLHAYETDFRRKVRAGDEADFFYDLKDEDKGADSPLGNLLFTSLTVSGKTKQLYRFRTPDGRIDYYDRKGENSRKFLTRKPVRSGHVRLTSGFGMRRHPLLGILRMHAGVDWAAPRGTPVMAAGNGTIEFAGRRGGYGNYMRIKHANGYKTAYAHMHRFARGMAPGRKVLQGETIGYIGNTGISSGPHLHFEVLVNNRPINPMKMRVPKERRLKGKALRAFKRERVRIDELMRRSPVTRLVR